MNKGRKEIKFNLKKIDSLLRELSALENRATACSNMKYSMQDSDGDPKTAFIDAYEAVTDCAASVALLISNTKDNLIYAKNRMFLEDKALKNNLNNMV